MSRILATVFRSWHGTHSNCRFDRSPLLPSMWSTSAPRAAAALSGPCPAPTPRSTWLAAPAVPPRLDERHRDPPAHQRCPHLSQRGGDARFLKPPVTLPAAAFPHVFCDLGAPFGAVAATPVGGVAECGAAVDARHQPAPSFATGRRRVGARECDELGKVHELYSASGSRAEAIALVMFHAARSSWAALRIAPAACPVWCSTTAAAAAGSSLYSSDTIVVRPREDRRGGCRGSGAGARGPASPRGDGSGREGPARRGRARPAAYPARPDDLPRAGRRERSARRQLAFSRRSRAAGAAARRQGVLKAWWHADDHSEWRWQVEFYIHR